MTLTNWRRKLNWRELNKQIPFMTEERLAELLAEERAGKRSLSVLERLHQRFCALRAARERAEILKEAETP